MAIFIKGGLKIIIRMGNLLLRILKVIFLTKEYFQTELKLTIIKIFENNYI